MVKIVTNIHLSPYKTEKVCTFHVHMGSHMYDSVCRCASFRLTTQCPKMSFFLVEIDDTHCDFKDF